MLNVGTVWWFLVSFWVLGSFVSLLRNYSSFVRRLAGYSGRRLHENEAKNSGEARPPLLLPFGLSVPFVSRKVGFCAFYVVGSLTSLVLRFQLERTVEKAVGIAIPLDVYFVHCSRRLLETIFVQQFSVRGDTMTLVGLVAGCSFYVAAPCSIALPLFSGSCAQRPRFSVIFLQVNFLFQALQFQHHLILAQLRGSVVRETYQYPAGNLLFEVLQEPHYFCELCIYLCFCLSLSVWCSLCLPAWLTLLFSLANLSVTALEHRRFWKAHKVKVPRSMLVPGVW